VEDLAVEAAVVAVTKAVAAVVATNRQRCRFLSYTHGTATSK
jgi:hypothetical protein